MSNLLVPDPRGAGLRGAHRTDTSLLQCLSLMHAVYDAETPDSRPTALAPRVAAGALLTVAAKPPGGWVVDAVTAATAFHATAITTPRMIKQWAAWERAIQASLSSERLVRALLAATRPSGPGGEPSSAQLVSEVSRLTVLGLQLHEISDLTERSLDEVRSVSPVPVERDPLPPRPAKNDPVYVYATTRGEVYYLHRKDVTLRGGRRQTIYYFARHLAEEAVALPDGYEVVENPRNGFTTLRRLSNGS